MAKQSRFHKIVVAEEPKPEPVAVPSQHDAPAMHLPELSKTFLFAGKACFTVSNPKAEHFTFKVRGSEREWPPKSGERQTTYFISVKAAGGQLSYRYIGIVNPDGSIKSTAKTQYMPGSKECDIAAWACHAVVSGKMIPSGYHIQHAGKCGRCNRRLTEPKSIERGIGPECWGLVGGK